MKERLDKLIVDRKIIKTREKAKAYIIGGNITVDGETVRKPGVMVNQNADIRIHLANRGYVSRGGLKLEGALEDFQVDVIDAHCLDIGASTGGFTDCLLKRGAKQVIALDVGSNQIDYRLRIDPRVIVIEKFNARYIDRLEIESNLDVVTIDVSFISNKHILKSLIHIVNEKSKIIALIKPQFELDKPYKGFKGVITDRNIHLHTLQELHNFFFTAGYKVEGYTFSKIIGPKGNIEYFVYLRKSDSGEDYTSMIWHNIINNIVERSHNYFF